MKRKLLLFKKNYFYFTLTVKPLVVQILTKEPRLSADKKYEVECRSSGSRPHANISWWIANRQMKKARNVSTTSDIVIPFVVFIFFSYLT